MKSGPPESRSTRIERINDRIRRGEDWFDDRTIPAGLRNDSFAMTGFGTQFIDGELDGWQDLVLTNGHFVDALTVRWPGEKAQRFNHLAADAEWLLVEGAEPLPLTHELFGTTQMLR